MPLQPYHAAEPLEFQQAEELVNRSMDQARHLALSRLRSVIEELHNKQYAVVACGILRSSARPVGPLAATLASHALIHSAEGELFRDALAYAAESCGLALTSVRERDVFSQGEARLGMGADELQRRLTALGRSIGPPWRQDEKLAALAAWLALAAHS